ncbi:hypothetical protein [Candidatus Babela massiliensis]|uniref:Uncharacterized protein n=1 Tax=Candidatus Babela massiliensis TaxID=673862 RepID=V6DFX6_9BACT|nr:hypothetical protein [Candidatus Babela massiliensis]CDK30482.1 hypothetical protein BABL1_gene_536 [Candidatus Babela massiliensis]
MSLIINSDLNQFSTNLINFKEECKRKALLTAQLKNILEGPYSKEKEEEAIQLIVK